jgi:competence protein ComEA
VSPLRALAVALLILLAPAAIASPTAASDADASQSGQLVDLNRAGVDELCTLPGIGRKKAEAIIALRERRPFTRVTQLLQIKGIGHKTLLKLKPRVTVTMGTAAMSVSATTATATTQAPSNAATR